MKKFTFCSLLILAACCVKGFNSERFSIDPECIRNPSAYPVSCANHINEVMKRLQNVGPIYSFRKVDRDVNGMVNGRRMAGKNVEEPQLDETRDNKLALTNQVIGNNAYLKPGLKPDLKPDLMQNSKQPNLINKVKNKVRGKAQNVTQGVRKLNPIRAIPKIQKIAKTKRSQVVGEILNDLAQAMRRIAIRNNFKDNTVGTAQQVVQRNEEDSKAIERSLQQLAVQNNIRSDKVNKLENIKEYNEEIVEALDLAFQLMNAKFDNYEDYVNLRNYLQKLAIKNHITGKTVNTAQNIKEFNGGVSDTITNLLKKKSIAEQQGALKQSTFTRPTHKRPPPTSNIYRGTANTNPKLTDNIDNDVLKEIADEFKRQDYKNYYGDDESQEDEASDDESQEDEANVDESDYYFTDKSKTVNPKQDISKHNSERDQYKNSQRGETGWSKPQ